MKVMFINTLFYKGHPKYNKKTHFVEKMYEYIGSFNTNKLYKMDFNLGRGLLVDLVVSRLEFYEDMVPAYHTIREGENWKFGDIFRPVVWAGIPYKSPLIQIADPIEVKKVWPIKIINRSVYISGKKVVGNEFIKLCNNEGLAQEDFFPYFNYLKGQIVCWNEKINYE